MSRGWENMTRIGVLEGASQVQKTLAAKAERLMRKKTIVGPKLSVRES